MKHSHDPIACLNHDEVCSCMKIAIRNLPEWIERIDNTVLSQGPLIQALAIAWEALESVGYRKIKWPNTLTMEMQGELKDALRRITELGK